MTDFPMTPGSLWQVKLKKMTKPANSTPNYSTTVEPTSPAPATNVLILNNEEDINLPIMTDVSGTDTKIRNFVFGENTSVYGSCSITWQGEMFVLGGRNDPRQISRVTE